MNELEEFYELLESIDITKIKDSGTRKQVGRFRNLARTLVHDNGVFQQQMDIMTQGEEVAAGLRQQLLDQSEQHIKQFEKATLSWLKIRERSLEVNRSMEA